MIAWVRTWVFRILFYAASVPIVLSAPLSAAVSRDAMHKHVHVWIIVHRFLARWILGVRVRVEGERPPGTYLFAVKHQAMFETLEMAQRIDGPLIVMKRELIDMPFWGRTARAYGAIGVDRDASSKALRQMLKEAAAARKENRSVLIFPEGTRVAVGEAPPLRSGFAGLYKALNMPVVCRARGRAGRGSSPSASSTPSPPACHARKSRRRCMRRSMCWNRPQVL